MDCKKCTGCRRLRPMPEFGLWRGSSDGRRQLCSYCATYRSRIAYRKKYGIIKPKKDAPPIDVIPLMNHQNKHVLAEALKLEFLQGVHVQVTSGAVSTFKISRMDDSMSVFQLNKPGREGSTYTFNRFSPLSVRNIIMMLSMDDIRLEKSVDDLKLFEILLLNV